MLYGLYVSAAGALANSYRQDVVANNLANADTVAFKRDMAMFKARPTEASENGPRQFTDRMLEKLGGGSFALPTHIDFSPGSLDITGNAYDLALAGEGFFQVQNDGQVQYTRDGRFAMDENNLLVTNTDHLPVLDETGQTIEIDPALSLNVNEAGLVSQNGNVVARLAVVDFEDTKGLRKQGNNIYSLEGNQKPQAIKTSVKQGALENSGVNAINQLTEMIKAQRSFETNISTLQLQDQTLGMAVTRLGSVS
ncbi:MAG: flagellar hook-basal body protein [Sedimentisphaerales bacterium]|nr:flagellar hook-basal body protein [Sedimentisphaerales bacterium]